MNKTVTANISGIVFHIEVDAYEELSKYLSKIRSYFQNSDEREEIMADIEARIAELLNAKLNDGNQVVRGKDVDEVMKVMGKPEQYVQGDEEPNQNSTASNSTYSSGKRRLYRDSDDRILGGVASGIGHYIGIDPLWLRLIFVLLVIAGASGIFIYVILWIVIPEAKSAAQKLQMKGEPVNIDNIGKAFEEGAKKVNEQFKNMDSKSIGKKLERFFESIFHILGVIIVGFLRFFGKIIGIVLLVIGTLLVFTFITGLLNADAIIYSFSPNVIFSFESKDLFISVFETQQQYLFAKVALFFLIGVPVIALIYGGLRLLFKIKRSGGIATALTVVWLIGLGASIIIGIQLGSKFKSESEIVEYYNIDSKFSEYVLELNEEGLPGEELVTSSESDFLLSIDKNNIYYGMPTLNITKSFKESLQLRIEKNSRGSSKRASIENARNIKYEIQQQGELLSFNSYLSFDRQRKIRGQEVQLSLLLPIGKIVYLDYSLLNLIYDVDNVSETLDSEMLGNKWVMLEEGLTCLDCADIEGISTEELHILFQE